MAIFGISFSATGAEAGAFYQLTLTSGMIVTGAASIVPTALTYTYFSAQRSLTVQAPAGVVMAGGTCSDENHVVAGSMIVSPPVNVNTIVQLLGDGGVLDSFTLMAGQTSGNFSWSVSDTQGYSSDDHPVLLEKIVPRKS